VEQALPRSTFSMRTGVARLRSVAPEAQLAMALRRLDPEVVTEPMLHELLHHACANSAVNIAMQYRWLALMRATMSSPTFGWGVDSLHIELAADLAATEALLQPLAEGVAHFAEFDCAAPAFPDDREAASSVRVGLTDAISFRLLTLKDGAPDDVRELRDAQRAEKLSATEIGRRADVLSHPLFPGTANDAYLIGYLTAKAAWDHYVGVAGPDPIAPSSFVEFLLYCFYEDWTLGALVLRPGPAGAEAVADRLAARVRALFAPDIDRRVRAFVEDKAQRQKRGFLPRGPEELTHGAFAGLDIGGDEIRAGMTALMRFHVGNVGPGAPLTEDGPPLPTNLTNLQHQALVAVIAPCEELTQYFDRNPAARGEPVRTLDLVLELPQLKRPHGAMLDVEVECGTDGEGQLYARAGEDADWVPVPAELAAAGLQTGRLVGVAMSTQFPWSLHCLMLVGDTVAGGWSFARDQADDELVQIASALRMEAQFEAATELSFERLTRYFASALASDEVPGVRERADQATVAICSAFREILAEHGWAGLFASGPPAIDGGLRNHLKGPLVRALAVAGLANAFSIDREEVAAVVAAEGLDLGELMAACEDLGAREGLWLLEVGEETLRARV
jgi:hypothetical protein